MAATVRSTEAPQLRRGAGGRRPDRTTVPAGRRACHRGAEAVQQREQGRAQLLGGLRGAQPPGEQVPVERLDLHQRVDGGRDGVGPFGSHRVQLRREVPVDLAAQLPLGLLVAVPDRLVADRRQPGRSGRGSDGVVEAEAGVDEAARRGPRASRRRPRAARRGGARRRGAAPSQPCGARRGPSSSGTPTAATRRSAPRRPPDRAGAPRPGTARSPRRGPPGGCGPAAPCGRPPPRRRRRSRWS
jgi:hypothetical protein